MSLPSAFQTILHSVKGNGLIFSDKTHKSASDTKSNIRLESTFLQHFQLLNDKHLACEFWAQGPEGWMRILKEGRFLWSPNW